MGYRIKTVASIIGIPRNTLLAWERRYQVVTPVRQSNGYREYSEADVARLRALKSLMDEGHRISEALSLLRDKPVAEQQPIEGLKDRVLSALLKLAREEAEMLIRRDASLSFSRQLDELYFPLLQEVGVRWEAGTLSVVQEHFVSQFCREQFTAMLLSLAHGPENGPQVLCAVYPDDLHDLPLLGVAVKLALKGHRILFLGARSPADSLLDMIKQHQPDMVCISVIIPVSADLLMAYAHRLSATGAREIRFGGAGLPRTGLEAVERVSWAMNAS